MIRKTALAFAAALSLAGAAHAGTYALTGSFDTAPAVNVLTGSFSFDDTQVAAGGFDGTFDLTALTFSFQGQSYTLALATDPYVQFESGTLTGPNALFTTPGGGSLALQSFFGSSNFTYVAATGTEQLGTLSFSVATVPEPGTWALMLGGLGAAALVRRRKV
jgi:hypothetical protein